MFQHYFSQNVNITTLHGMDRRQNTVTNNKTIRRKAIEKKNLLRQILDECITVIDHIITLHSSIRAYLFWLFQYVTKEGCLEEADFREAVVLLTTMS